MAISKGLRTGKAQSLRERKRGRERGREKAGERKRKRFCSMAQMKLCI